jgi:hypothetical protein
VINQATWSSRTVRDSSVDEETQEMFFDRALFYNQPRVRSKVIQFVTGLTIVEVEMLIRHVHRNLSYVEEKSWIQDDSPFDDPLHFRPQGAAQFSQRFSSLLSSDTANLSKHSAVASVQGSPCV